MVAAVSMDRLQDAWERLLNAFLGRKAAKTIDACALYFGRVVKVDGAKVDVQLDTDQIASPSGVPLYVGYPGSVTVPTGTRVLVGFRNGDPSQPYAIAFEQGTSATLTLIAGSTVTLGADSGAQFIALANLVLTRLNDIHTALSGATLVVTGTCPPMGGPLSGGTATLPTYTAPASVAATQSKAK